MHRFSFLFLNLNSPKLRCTLSKIALKIYIALSVTDPETICLLPEGVEDQPQSDAAVWVR